MCSLIVNVMLTGIAKEISNHQNMSSVAPNPAQTNPIPKLRCRDDLQITFQSYGDRPCYLLEDPLNGQFFQIGEVEHAIISQLDGEVETSEVLAHHPELAPEQAQQLCQWLLTNQLAYFFDYKTQTWQLLPARKPLSQQLARYFNPLFIKIPLGSPDRLMNHLFSGVRWMLGWPFFWVWLLVCCTGVYQVAANWPRFLQAAEGLLSIYNLLLLVAAWVLTKIVHELFHGFVCKKYGGHIHQAGILLILFMPLGGYVNASASWRFTSRWQRMHVSAAGMFSDLWLGALAAWVWAYTDTGLINYLAYNIVIITTIGTLLFNANPLMRFDGYYILTDWLDIPNLYTSGQRYIQYLGQRYLLGLAVKLPQWRADHAWIIKSYGVAAWIWRWFIMFVLLVLATTLLDETGMVLAVLAAALTLGIPLVRGVTRVARHPRKITVMRRLALITVVGGGLLLISLTQLTWTSTITVPAVVDYADATLLRAETAGFVRKIYVQAGETVTAGQPLLQLDNAELVAEAQDLALQIEQQTLQQAHYLKTKELGSYQAVGAQIKQLRREWLDRQRQVLALTVVAPHDGTVIAAHLPELIGTYLPRGELILTLADPQQLDIQLSIPQQHIEAFRARLGQAVMIYRDAQPLHALPATLSTVNPRASQTIQHPALTAIGGGPLLVKPLPEAQQSKEELGYVHLAPRFTGTVTLSDAIVTKLYAGETAQVLLDSPAQSLGAWLWVSITRYADSIVTQAESF